MSQQAKLSRKIEGIRKRAAKNVLMASPEKEQCQSCGRFVVAGPMGLSRHLASFPQCSVDHSRDGTTNEARVGDGHSTYALRPRLGNLKDDRNYLPSPAVDEVDFGAPTFSDEDEDGEEDDVGSNLLLDNATFSEEEAGFGDRDLEPSSDDSDGEQVEVPNSFGDAWSKRDDDDGLNLSMFSFEEEVQVDLLQTMRRLRCPLIAYDEVMKWAVRSCSRGHKFRDLPISSRKTVMEKLCSRVEVVGLTPILKTLYLPYSNVHVEIVFFSAHAVFNSFLSCTELNRDENYIFDDPDNPDVNPFAKPSGTVLGDINTGKSYLKTYDLLVKKAEDMLLPCVLAIDKTTCDIGGGGRLSLEPIIVSYGLMRHDIRKTPAAMRVLGFINTTPEKERPFPPGEDRPETPLPVVGAAYVTDAVWRTNEYHLQLDFILRESGYLALQESGLKWNLHYRGKSSPVHLHLYVPFIVGDTAGHDVLCGHYTSRTKVAQLCRACVCPLEKSSYSKARSYARRTPQSVNAMVNNREFDLLRANSQQFLINAFDSIRFGMHNNRGIYGACPGEILHLILIGWFKCVMDSFFLQIGKSSEFARRYNNLLLDINSQVGRQSDRNVPKTCVTKGFISGANIPGHEYAGCMFIMLISMSTTHFAEIFKSAKKSKRKKKGKKASKAKSLQPPSSPTAGVEADPPPPPTATEVEADMSLSNPNFVNDWSMFLSSLLEWHAWLKQSRISRLAASRSGLAVSALMRSLKFVAPRLSGGMGNTTIKTHLVLHMEEDMLNFGVPEVMNSSYFESAHISISKVTARNTQKRTHTFTLQAAQRYLENLAIRKGVSNISDMPKRVANTMPPTHRLQGKRFTLEEDGDGVVICKRNASKKKKADDLDAPEEYHLTSHISMSLAKHVLPHTTGQILNCHTEYKSAEGQIYRAHPCYHDKPWFDYAVINWVGYGECPGRIHAFLNLDNIERGAVIVLPHSEQQVTVPSPGFYAVIESYTEVVLEVADDSDDEVEEGDPPDEDDNDDDDSEEEEEDRSIFRKFRVDLMPNGIDPILYLIHVDSIKRPTIAVADNFSDLAPCEDGQTLPNTDYIVMMLPQTEWATTWDSFIHQEYKDIVLNGVRKEKDESGDEGFVREELFVPPSSPSHARRRRKAAAKRKLKKNAPAARGRETMASQTSLKRKRPTQT